MQFIFTGTPVNSQNEYTNGLLVGELADKYAPNYGDDDDCIAYVLQNHDGVVGFYKVSDDNILVKANRCYLRVPNDGNNVRAFYFGTEDEETGIDQIENGNLKDENPAIFDLSGRRVSRLQRGINIINGRKVLK